jgi:hypothetical protein
MAWLLVSDEWRTIVTSTALEPMTDLRATLEAAWQKRIAEGWRADRTGRHTEFFFCKKEDQRLLTIIRRPDPAPPPQSTAPPQHNIVPDRSSAAAQ